ncbi:MerR HTH family regulatory protein [Loktanella atrilutea]|uniref:MerR HTH family regulatory protein n=1 Tax=Loktanella atrilutea TaxID=366533 RepID=A0A1M4UY25_LOKAT|nr:MerR family transcriptional regulator [Loktanella atrilutea]SHE61550.1 MerR HTH family regulatory protein [Loktanella atrilutea]
MAKAPDAFRTISEVADQLDTPAHVLRFWESKFTQVKPVKRAGGRRYYRPDDVALLGGIKALLHDQGMTIKGAQKMLRERGVKVVMAMGQPEDAETGEVIDAVAAPPTAPRMTEADALRDAPSAEGTDASDNVVPLPFEVPARQETPDTALPDMGEPELVEPDAPDFDAPEPVDAHLPDANPSEETGSQLYDEVAPADDGESASLAPIEETAPSLDLPPDPAPRTDVPSRVLADLGRMNRDLSAARRAALAPVVDRLGRVHAAMTAG